MNRLESQRRIPSRGEHFKVAASASRSQRIVPGRSGGSNSAAKNFKSQQRIRSRSGNFQVTANASGSQRRIPSRVRKVQLAVSRFRSQRRIRSRSERLQVAANASESQRRISGRGRAVRFAANCFGSQQRIRDRGGEFQGAAEDSGSRRKFTRAAEEIDARRRIFQRGKGPRTREFLPRRDAEIRALTLSPEQARRDAVKAEMDWPRRLARRQGTVETFPAVCENSSSRRNGRNVSEQPPPS